MSWHHIIPFPLLRDVWNRLVDRHIGTQLGEARVAIRQYLLLVDSKLPDIDELIDRMRAENTEQKRAGHNQLKPLDEVEVHALQTAAIWPAWNVVEGPRKERRSDDPEHYFLDRFTAGVTAHEAARMRVIEGLFPRLQEFVNTGEPPGPDRLKMLAQVAATGRTTLSCDAPISYRPEMWVQDGSGFWRKRRNGERLAGRSKR